ncbi:transcription termination/antitermination protein NusA [Candidatus Nomurabacteria bacterium]|nr:transcription termination/antitermination protein NusA [Candidatus Nomurabacteria bacterium]
MRSALEQLEEERGIPKEKILSAIEDALIAAYKKDYGKKDQIVQAKLDYSSGKVDFCQVKIVVDKEMLLNEDEEAPEDGGTSGQEENKKVHFNPEHHLMLEDARKIRSDAEPGDELTFPLETKEDYGRIAAQTAKQVIIQRLREAEKYSVLAEYEGREGEIVNGKVQKMERGNVFVDLGRTTGLLSREEQIPGEYYRQGERLKAYLYSVEETPRGINLRLSRAHPKFVEQLFAVEAPEIASGKVVVKAIAREPGARTKIAVHSTDPNIDPVGSCVGQRGVRVNTVISELGGEKIDIIEWEDSVEEFIRSALSPAKINTVTLFTEENRAQIEVDADQFSLAVGRGGQNARLAAKLTGWKIDIIPPPSMPTQESKPVEKEAEAMTEPEIKTETE